MLSQTKVIVRILLIVLLYFVAGNNLYAQKEGADLDALRKKEEAREDSVIYNSKMVRYTTSGLFKNGTQTLPLDTTLRNFENYNLLYQPERPTIGLGSLGLSYRDLLFNPSKSIGFDVGFHALDIYMLRPDQVRYYRARSPFTELYYINGGSFEQVFKAKYSQNARPNFNFGGNYDRIGSDGFYFNQNVNHLNAALYTWYESPNKRYNLLANAVFNTLVAGENGSTVNDSIFSSVQVLRKDAQIVRLSATGATRPRQTWRQQSFSAEQFYYIGRIDTLTRDSLSKQILPTQRISHAINYSTNRYKFFRDEPDKFGAFPKIPLADSILTNDSTQVKNLRNEFTYSFYLRGKTVSFLKNEVKLDLGLQHDLYWYNQMGFSTNFQNITLHAGVGYRFSDRVDVVAKLQQIAQGRNAGDFLYEANTNFLLSKSLGRIVLGAYSQNKSPEQVFERINYQFHQWNLNFNRTKINNLSFLYENPKLQFSGKAEYFLVNNYLYFQETTPAKQIAPVQLGQKINLLKLSVGKNFSLGKFHLDNYLVYQKTNFKDILRTPEIYTYSSLYWANTFFKVLHTNIGADMRYHSTFKAPAYDINASQFYNDNSPVVYDSEPVIGVWIKATLKRTNLLLKYDYANQGLFSKGFYTVRAYPMQDALFKFGLSWKFYN
ncbi:MAG TPA: putative porin [Daejeonella sp.]|nr:putative porin [Daejeonella sp.]